MSEHKSKKEIENKRYQEAKAHDARKDKDFAIDDVRKDEDFAVEVVRKDENFVENAVLSDVRHDASTEHTQPDIPIETGSVLSIRPEIIPSPMFVRRQSKF